MTTNQEPSSMTPDHVIELVDILSWPVVALVAIIVFKRPVVSLLTNFKELAYKDYRFKFGAMSDDDKLALEEMARKYAEGDAVHETGPAGNIGKLDEIITKLKDNTYDKLHQLRQMAAEAILQVQERFAVQEQVVREARKINAKTAQGGMEHLTKLNNTLVQIDLTLDELQQKYKNPARRYVGKYNLYRQTFNMAMNLKQYMRAANIVLAVVDHAYETYTEAAIQGVTMDNNGNPVVRTQEQGQPTKSSEKTTPADPKNQ